ncbi:MAG: TonB-dependent receptor plug domain-containing protein [Sphingomonadales bacterium]
MAATMPAVMAAEEEDAAAADAIEEVYVTGSRRAARSAADTPAPVDVISGNDFVNQGGSDIADLLRTVVPSFNVNAQPISDAATLVRPANLRGLPPDNTLILVNGKRRHRAAVISFLGGGLSDGAQGPDISAIPAIALKQVEVLRDGAAAQYGSDAIAGVMNFILKDGSEGGSLEAKYGSTYEGDGDAYQFAANYGMRLGDSGFANLSAEFREADPTSRSVQRDDAAALIAGGNTAVRDPAQIWGQPEIRNDFKIFLNMAVDAGENREFYAFGNYSERTAEGGFFFRNPNTRPGVFSNDGGVTRLVGDMTPGDGITCTGGINFATGVIDNPLVIGSAGEAAALAAISADPNCFAFNELFEGGFTPSFGGKLNDIAGVMGLRGEMESGLTYDVSVGAGRNEADFFISNTVNASLGSATPTTFELGSYTQLEKNVNVDLTYPVKVPGFASDLNVAGGFEWREEQFQATVGQPESFEIGVLAAPFDIPGVGPVTQGFGIGSNGFSGFNPDVAGTFDRTNVALYLDLEADVTEDLILGAAVRWEDFSDFGTTTNFKLSGLYHVTDGFSVRSTYATGFRAPTPGQANVSNISTVFEGGVLTQRGTIPPTNPIAVSKGGKLLQPENSDSFTVGFAFNAGGMSVTADYFNIKVSDRITQSASISLTAAEAAALEASGITGASDLGTFRFFTNDFDTRTQGIDVVATVPLDFFEGGDTTLGLVGNWTDTEVTDFNPNLLDATRIRQLEDNLPSVRGSATLVHVANRWRGLARVNYFGSYFEAHLDDGTLPIEAGSEFTVDVELGVSVIENMELVVGAENVFNNFPDRNPWATIVGAKYPVTSPMGFNGGFYYTKLRYNF